MKARFMNRGGVLTALLLAFSLIFFALTITSCKQDSDDGDENVNYAPIGLAVKATGYHSVQVSWNKVPYAVYYTVKYYKKDLPNLWKVETNLTTNSCSIAGLDDGTTYYFLVRAAFDKKYKNTTDWSSPVKVTLSKDTSPKPGKLSYSDLTSSSITLSWTEYSLATSYYIEYSDSIGGNERRIECGKNTTCTISNLSPSIEYDFRLRGYRDDGMILLLDAISAFTLAGTTPLSTPSIRASVGGNKITVSWNTISGATKYYIKIYNSSSKLIGTYEASSVSTSYTFTGLKSGATYKFQMWAYNGSVYSSRSNLITATSM